MGPLHRAPPLGFPNYLSYATLGPACHNHAVGAGRSQLAGTQEAVFIIGDSSCRRSHRESPTIRGLYQGHLILVSPQEILWC